MVRCPNCEEELHEDAIKCDFCDELIHNNIPETTVPTPAPFDKLLFRLTLSAILLRDVLVILIAVYSVEGEMSRAVMGVFWDAVFLSFLSMGKNWARTLLKIKYIIGLLSFSVIYYSSNNYLLGTLDLTTILCVLLLLFSQNSPKLRKYAFSTFCISFIVEVGFQTYNIMGRGKREKRN